MAVGAKHAELVVIVVITYLLFSAADLCGEPGLRVSEDTQTCRVAADE